MPLPWVRLDSNIASHDKILALLEEKPAARAYQAAFSYVAALGHCGGHGTDGLITFSALRFVHGTRATAELLVTHGLWVPDPLGWRIPRWAERQQSEAVTTNTKLAQSMGARKANCVRWHGSACGCWERAQ